MAKDTDKRIKDQGQHTKDNRAEEAKDDEDREDHENVFIFFAFFMNLKTNRRLKIFLKVFRRLFFFRTTGPNRQRMMKTEKITRRTKKTGPWKQFFDRSKFWLSINKKINRSFLVFDQSKMF